MIKNHESLLIAVEQSAGENVLRETCINLLNKGISSNTLLDEFEALRSSRQLDEDYEDTILDMMDTLSGWCSAQRALV